MKNPWVIDGRPDDSEESGSVAEEIISMTNLQRLAVVDGDIPPGQLVKVTDQANRIEMYLGGGSGNSHWEVVVNSYVLQLYNDSASPYLYGIQINGVIAPTQSADYNVVTTIGWVKDGDVITCMGTNSYSNLERVWVWNEDGVYVCGAHPGLSTWSETFGLGTSYVPISLSEFSVSPIRVPPRGTLRIKG